MPDARCTRSRLCSKKHRRQQLQVHRINRHSLRNGFNGVLRALLGDHAWLPPSSADRSAHLAPALERQDHTTSPSAQTPLVAQSLRSAMCVHRIPLPTSVTTAKRPSCGNETAETVSLIWVKREAEYFCAKGWTAFRMRRFFCPSGKSPDVVCREHLPPPRHCKERQRRSNPGPWTRFRAMDRNDARRHRHSSVMAGPVPAIHVLSRLAHRKTVDARDKPGHDGASGVHLTPSSPSAPPRPTPRCSRGVRARRSRR